MAVHSVKPAEQHAKKKGRRRHVGHRVEHLGKGGFTVSHEYQDGEGGYSPSRPSDKLAFEDSAGLMKHLGEVYGAGGKAGADGDEGAEA